MNVVTREQIQEMFKISRTTFNEKYKPFVKQVPSLSHINHYDLESVQDWHAKRPKKESGRPRKKNISIDNQ